MDAAELSLVKLDVSFRKHFCRKGFISPLACKNIMFLHIILKDDT